MIQESTLRRRPPLPPLFVPLLGFALALSASGLLGAAVELYGKPLRGLTSAPLATLVGRPELFLGKTIRVSGAIRSGKRSGVAISEGESTLLVQSDGSFELPADAMGARLDVEGRLKKGTSALVFVASGAELKR